MRVFSLMGFHDTHEQRLAQLFNRELNLAGLYGAETCFLLGTSKHFSDSISGFAKIAWHHALNAEALHAAMSLINACD